MRAMSAKCRVCMCVTYVYDTAAAEMSIKQPIEKLPAIQRDQQFTVSNTQQRTKK